MTIEDTVDNSQTAKQPGSETFKAMLPKVEMLILCDVLLDHQDRGNNTRRQNFNIAYLHSVDLTK